MRVYLTDMISFSVGDFTKYFPLKCWVSTVYCIPVEGAVVILELTFSVSLSLKSYLFLLSSDYERSEWRESIQKLQKKG